MGRLNHRTRFRRKLRTARSIINDSRLDDETKRLALALLNFANEDGVIINDDVNAMIHEALTGNEKLREGSADGGAG